MTAESCSTKTGQLEFLISSYFEVQQLSTQVRQKWEQAAVETACATLSLAEITQRQHAAEEKRLEQQKLARGRTRACKRSLQSEEEAKRTRAQRLEARLADAKVKRQTTLEGRKLKATALLQRSLEAAERLSERQSERAARLDAKLEQAEKVREEQIAAAAARGSDTAARARAVSAAARAKEEAAASKRRVELEQRLQRAGDARHEFTQTVLASLAPRGTEPFLVRRALTRSILRRQSSSRMLQRSWRAFAEKKRTTASLASSLLATGITAVAGKAGPPNPPLPPARSCERVSSTSTSPGVPATPANTPATTSPEMSPGGSPKRRRPAQPEAAPSSVALVGLSTTILNAPHRQQAEDPFEAFARKLQSPATLQAATSLLRRLAAKQRPAARAAGVDALLKKLFPKARKPDRYPVRVFLCAYMILRHPHVVFNQRGEREAALSTAADDMVAAFEKLLVGLTQPTSSTSRALQASSTSQFSVAALLAAFDRMWLQYLEQFVAWKLADAASLEAELVRVAVEMEASKLAKLNATGSTSPRQFSPADRQALVEQVERDHELLRERIQRLGGQAGITRLEAGLAAARASAAELQASNPARTPPASPSRGSSAHSSPVRSNPTTPVRPTSAASAGSPSTPRSAVTNESLAWELLYDLDFQLPTEDAEAAWRDATEEGDVMLEAPQPGPAATARRVRRIAERAFWDSLAASDPAQISNLLHELAMQLVDALPPRSRVGAEVKQQFSVDLLRDAIAQGSAEQLLPAFQQLAAVLHEVGSPARQAPAEATHSRIRAELQSAAGSSAALGAVLVKALRLMAAQLQLLQVDMSNATLRMLAGTLADGEGVRHAHRPTLMDVDALLQAGFGEIEWLCRYAQTKFAERHEISANVPAMDLASRLPHTRAWLANASGNLRSFQATPLQAGAEAPAVSAPIAMRTGRAMHLDSHDTSNPPQKRPVAGLVREAGFRTWRGLVRIGLVQTIAADQPPSSQPPLPLPETLQLDAGRIFATQEAFQGLLVLSACLLVSQQAASNKGLPAPDISALKTRLKVLLKSEQPALQSLAAEMAACIGSTSEDAEGLLQALTRMLARGSPGFKALTQSLAKALQQTLVLERPLTDAELRPLLARCGAGDLTAEARDLSNHLAEIAAVTEAVHADVYGKLADGLL